jgi:hypothetical protein
MFFPLYKKNISEVLKILIILLSCYFIISCSSNNDYEREIIYKAEFYVDKNMNFLPCKNTYVLMIKGKYLVFKMEPVEQISGNIIWENKKFDYSKESTSINWTLYSNNFLFISRGQSIISNGRWSLGGLSFTELEKHVIYFPYLKIDDLSIHFQPDASQYAWVHFGTKCKIGIINTKAIQKLSADAIKSVKFEYVYE